MRHILHKITFGIWLVLSFALFILFHHAFPHSSGIPLGKYRSWPKESLETFHPYPVDNPFKDDVWLVLIAILFLLIIIYYANTTLRHARQQFLISRALKKRAATDAKWQKTKLLETAREKFYLLQTAWHKQDLDILCCHLHPALFKEWQDNVTIESEKPRLAASLSIKSAYIESASNFPNDHFMVLLKIKDGRFTFQEIWTFAWINNEWLLESISGENAWKFFGIRDNIFKPEARSITKRPDIVRHTLNPISTHKQ